MSEQQSGSPAKKILVLPIGDDIGPDILEIIAANIQTNLSLPVDVLDSIPLPSEPYSPQRGQYNALAFLKILQSMKRSDGAKLLGVVKVDLFIPIFTYVFGEAQLGQSCAVISLWRLWRMNDGSRSSLPLYFERAAKLAVHELAHTFNLSHCDNANCILKYMPDLDTLDAQDLLFCHYCDLDLKESIDSWR